MTAVRASGGGRKNKAGTSVAVSGNEALASIDPPDALRDDAAHQMWLTQAAVLCGRSALTLADAPQLLIYCNSFSLYLEAEKKISEEGLTLSTATGGEKKHPAINARQDAISAMTRAGSLLGLDPLSRTRLIGGGRGDGKKDNEFSEF